MTQNRLRRALVLAGRRSTGDALAESEGFTHKALLPIGGVPMGIRVLKSLAAIPTLERIGVSCDDPQLVARLEGLMSGVRPGLRLEHHPSARSPAASLGDFIASLSNGELALVTTADHPLMSTEIVRYFVEEASARDADLVAGVVSERVYRARVAYFWVGLEGVRKRPWRLVSHFGVGTLVRFLLGRLTLARALADASQAIGAQVDAVSLPFAEAALDVDKPADLATVKALLEGGAPVENPSGAG
jgi:CTP:molybdopterin cytidylyltransferase MocA